jgi:hypothetical protein
MHGLLHTCGLVHRLDRARARSSSNVRELLTGTGSGIVIANPIMRTSPPGTGRSSCAAGGGGLAMGVGVVCWRPRASQQLIHRRLRLRRVTTVRAFMTVHENGTLRFQSAFSENGTRRCARMRMHMHLVHGHRGRHLPPRVRFLRGDWKKRPDFLIDIAGAHGGLLGLELRIRILLTLANGPHGRQPVRRITSRLEPPRPQCQSRRRRTPMTPRAWTRRSARW